MLKVVKYPEISYRKFCGDDKAYKSHKDHSPYIGMDNKQNRAFIGLPLNRKQMLSHVQLCQFRSSLTFAQLVNLTVYHDTDGSLFEQSGVHLVKPPNSKVSLPDFTTLATLLLEFAGTRRTKKIKQEQVKLPLVS